MRHPYRRCSCPSRGRICGSRRSRLRERNGRTARGRVHRRKQLKGKLVGTRSFKQTARWQHNGSRARLPRGGVLFEVSSAKKNPRRLTRRLSYVDTSCMKALQRVKSFEGFFASFFSRRWACGHTSTRAEEVLLLSGVGGDGWFFFHL